MENGTLNVALLLEAQIPDLNPYIKQNSESTFSSNAHHIQNSSDSIQELL